MKRVFITALVVVFAAPGAAFAAFPGGQGRLAFDSQGQIYTINPDGSSLTALAVGVYPRWSPHGQRIAYERGGDIWVMRSNGSHQHRITTLGDATQPAWSASGRRIVFVRLFGHPQDGGNIWVMRRDGANRHALTHRVGPCGNSYPTWSPVGRRIAIQQQPDPADPSLGICPAGILPRVVVLNVRTHARHVLPAAFRPAFTPDAGGIAWSDTNDLVWATRPTGEGEQRVSDFDCLDGGPCMESWALDPASTFATGTRAAVSATYPYTDSNGQDHVNDCLTVNGAGVVCGPDDTIDFFDLDWQPVN
jgi:Dipeptidyl peptidase IV (DPP IV) N-terminal region